MNFIHVIHSHRILWPYSPTGLQIHCASLTHDTCLWWISTQALLRNDWVLEPFVFLPGANQVTALSGHILSHTGHIVLQKNIIRLMTESIRHPYFYREKKERKINKYKNFKVHFSSFSTSHSTGILFIEPMEENIKKYIK